MSDDVLKRWRAPRMAHLMSAHAQHGRLLEEILLKLGSKPGIMVWRNVTGRFFAPRTGQWVTVGVPGAPDILGVALGRAVAIEVKTGKGRLGLAQRKWKAAFENRGGLYIEARSVDDAEEALLGLTFNPAPAEASA